MKDCQSLYTFYRNYFRGFRARIIKGAPFSRRMPAFKLSGELTPKGDQPQAIQASLEGFKKQKNLTLLGVTGSGKTFTMANIIAALNVPTIIISPNKTLAAQLYSEFCRFFPENAVEYFISYFDYYRPESYLPTTDTYLEKESQVNEKIEQMRLSATSSLITRRDVIIIASVSCIYGLGSPASYRDLSFTIKKSSVVRREQILHQLLDIQYERNDTDPTAGKFRVRGDILDIGPSYKPHLLLRIEFFGDEIERIAWIDALTGNTKEELDEIMILPAKHFVVPDSEKQRALDSIRKELEEVLPGMSPLEAERLRTRVNHDIEMIQELGYCSGIENYSRHFENRVVGSPPSCLLDFFPEDSLIIIDESHVAIPQLEGMYKGDFSRKKNLIDHGFRLPSAYDHRPLKFEEFERYIDRRKTLFVSATPASYELKRSKKKVVEQIIRPTGLVDPLIEVQPTKNQIDHLIGQIKLTAKKGFRTLVTTLTKKMAEDLTEYLAKAAINVRYLHSEIETLERSEIIRQLRLGEFDVLVGINLLREGLDLPEVSLVAILDADKEGFLRSTRSLIQTVGRAARNTEGRVIFYADKMTDSMKETIDETKRRRKLQEEFNKAHGIIPKTILKPIEEKKTDIKSHKHLAKADIPRLIIDYEARMRQAAEELDFEKAIECRDAIAKLQKQLDE